MKPVYIIEAKRTPIGRFGGGLKTLSAAELGHGLGEAMLPQNLRPHIQQVILGQVLQAGAGMNVARQIGLKLGLPQEVPAFTVNMACGSSLKAVALAADAIASGESDLILAGGVESMSRAPHYAMDLRFGKKLGDSSLQDAMFVDGLTDPLLKIGMGETAERIADKHGITRAEQDAFAALSQSRVAASRAALSREIIPAGDLTDDEHPRADTTVESLAKLKPAFRKNGTVTAGNASGINDGAALVLLAGEDAVSRHGLQPRARIIATAAVGCDPAVMGLGPVGAIRKVCAQTGWSLDQVDAIEINEAFAVQTLGCVKELGLDTARLNPRGGAIALGHPIGASGARVLITLLHHLEDNNFKRGIASLCIGGGMGIAMAVETAQAD
ncbi:MAG: acetyl-CoA C-acyltransferase [Verrucomicrobiaceae bacterium]|nr:acetyl-CoA C-acyltransferase [Verrucomicrobiaceae bacterium]